MKQNAKKRTTITKENSTLEKWMYCGKTFTEKINRIQVDSWRRWEGERKRISSDWTKISVILKRLFFVVWCRLWSIFFSFESAIILPVHHRHNQYFWSEIFTCTARVRRSERMKKKTSHLERYSRDAKFIFTWKISSLLHHSSFVIFLMFVDSFDCCYSSNSFDKANKRTNVQMSVQPPLPLTRSKCLSHFHAEACYCMPKSEKLANEKRTQ